MRFRKDEDRLKHSPLTFVTRAFPANMKMSPALPCDLGVLRLVVLKIFVHMFVLKI